MYRGTVEVQIAEHHCHLSQGICTAMCVFLCRSLTLHSHGWSESGTRQKSPESCLKTVWTGDMATPQRLLLHTRWIAGIAQGEDGQTRRWTRNPRAECSRMSETPVEATSRMGTDPTVRYAKNARLSRPVRWAHPGDVSKCRIAHRDRRPSFVCGAGPSHDCRQHLSRRNRLADP